MPSARFAEGIEWGGICFAVYSIVCFVVAFALPKLASATSRKTVHALSLVCGGVGLLSTYVIHDPRVLLLTMIGVGIAWASTLSMPYAILSGALPPARMGVYMGIFNFFIVIPEITASLGFGWVMNHLLNNNRLAAVVAGGIFFMLAAVLTQRVEDLYDYDLRKPSSIPSDAVAAKS